MLYDHQTIIYLIYHMLFCQAEGDFYDSPTKSSKKSKRIGFGSLFDKRSSAKMNQTEVRHT